MRAHTKANYTNNNLFKLHFIPPFIFARRLFQINYTPREETNK